MKDVTLGTCILAPHIVYVTHRKLPASSTDLDGTVSSFKMLFSTGMNTMDDHGGGLRSAAVTLSRNAGKIDLFATGANSAVWYKYYNGSSWADWTSMSGNMTTGPTVLSSSPGRLNVLVTSKDHTIQHKWKDDSQNTWSSWETLSGHWHSSVGAVSRSIGLMDLVAISPAFEICYKLHDNDNLRPWQCLGGRFKSSPVIVSPNTNRIDIFALDVNNNILYKSGTGSDADITSWTPAGTEWSTVGYNVDSPPAVIASTPTRIDICTITSAGELWYNALVDGAWLHGGYWLKIAASSLSAPVLTSSAPGYVEVWCVDGNTMWSRRLNTATNTWAEWKKSGPNDLSSTVYYNGQPPPYVASYQE